MFEDDWVLPTKDGKKIYGRTVHAHSEPADETIIFVHGLTCDISNAPYLSAARSFAKKGYDCILFNLYDWREDARHLNDCTLKIHATDLDRVLDKKAKNYGSIFLIGHSYGGPVILQSACKSVKAVSLWDPSYNIADWWPHWTYQKNGMSFFRGFMDILMPELLNAEALTLDLEACRQLGRAFKKPMQVLHAGQGILYKYGESYHSHSKAQTNYAFLPEADHSFTTESAMKQAVKKADLWFRRINVLSQEIS